MTGFDDIKRKLADRWENRSPKDIANQFSKPLFGGAGEWDLPAGITPKKALLYLAVGIPDTNSLPKTQLQTASDRINNMPGDLAWRYGFGLGPKGIRASPPPRAISALTDGYGVITTGTFSKTVATGIRVGYIHARPEILSLFGRMRFAMGQNQLGLRAFGAFLEAGDYEPHLANIRNVYRQKRDALDKALSKEVGEYLDWQFPEGGFYLWATLKKDMNVTPLWRTAVEEGIVVNPGTGFSQPGTPPAECIRIAYAWTPIEQFAEAATRLRIACERVVAGEAA